jgi:hypothetical protein
MQTDASPVDDRLEISETPAPHAAAPEPAPAATAPAPAAPATPDPEDPLVKALAAQRRAEELQAHHQQHQAAAPQLSEHKQRFLAAHPEMFHPLHARLMSAAYQQGLQAGILDDSVAMDEHIVAAVHHQLAHLTQAAAANVKPEGGPLIAPPPVAPMPPAAPTPAMMPPSQPSIPISAPVSRGAPNLATGRMQQKPGSVTLNRTEREIARVSFPHLPPHEAELAYAKNKVRYQREKSEGHHQG